MQQRLIRYQTKPGTAARNEELIRAVYAELHQAQPAGLRYAAFRLADQVTFLHLVQLKDEDSPNPLLAVKAFGEFQAGIGDRVVQAPVQEELSEVGSYRVFSG